MVLLENTIENRIIQKPESQETRWAMINVDIAHRPTSPQAARCTACDEPNPSEYVQTSTDRKGYFFWVVIFAAASVMFPEYAGICQIIAGIFLYSFLDTIIPLTQILVLLFFLWLFSNVFGQ